MSTSSVSPAVAVVAQAHLELCRQSAELWNEELPRYADARQRRADRWALVGGVVASATALAVWPVLGQSSSSLEKTIVTVAALVAALANLMPRVYGDAELAGQARELASQYGALTGQFESLVALSRARGGELPYAEARAALETFGAVKAKKDGLRYLRPKDAILAERAQRRRERTRAERAEAGRSEAEAVAQGDAAPRPLPSVAAAVGAARASTPDASGPRPQETPGSSPTWPLDVSASRRDEGAEGRSSRGGVHLGPVVLVLTVPSARHGGARVARAAHAGARRVSGGVG